MLRLRIKLYDGREGRVNIDKDEGVSVTYLPTSIARGVLNAADGKTDNVKEVDVLGTDEEEVSFALYHLKRMEVLRFQQNIDLKSFSVTSKKRLRVIGLPVEGLEYASFDFNTDIDDLDKKLRENPDMNILFEDNFTV